MKKTKTKKKRAGATNLTEDDDVKQMAELMQIALSGLASPQLLAWARARLDLLVGGRGFYRADFMVLLDAMVDDEAELVRKAELAMDLHVTTTN